ncbi:MAG: hypothetical protein WC391_06135 [Methanoregula sp.]|jgi:hypothetical protein
MDFGSIGTMGGAVAGYISTPEGQEKVKAFLSSPDGISLLKNFASTPEGQKVMMSVLPSVLGGLNLPPGVADMIKGALGSQQ